MRTLSLPPDLARALAERARREGITPEDLALRYLHERFLRAPDSTVAGNTKMDG